MRFLPTTVEGARLVELEPRTDERGFFARMFCAGEFAAEGLETSFRQVNDALSHTAGTLRGLHYQVAPAGEVKLVRCLRGAAFDVLVDLRAGSPSFGRWAGAELTSGNRRMMHVPRGCAHGYLTLEPDTELLYFASDPYVAAHERALRWDDPAIGIAWPRPAAVISDKDRTAPAFDAAYHASGY